MKPTSIATKTKLIDQLIKHGVKVTEKLKNLLQFGRKTIKTSSLM
jgi:hypothetical protein